MEQTLGPKITWTSCDAEQATEIMRAARSLAPGLLDEVTLLGVTLAALPFYKQHALIRLEFIEKPERLKKVYLLFGEERALWLDGTSWPIHAVNQSESLSLTEDTVLDYVRFFLCFVRGGTDAFVLVESGDKIQVVERPDVVPSIRNEVVPFALLDPLDDGRLHVSATIAYEGALYESTFGVAPNGEIEMLEDDPIGKLEGLSLPTCPELAPPPGFAARAETPTEGQVEDSDETPSDSGGGGDDDDEARTDREVTEAVVEVLLTEAVRDAMDHTLLQRFNLQSSGSGPLPQLCRFLQSSQPIVIIESEIPFIEDIVAGLLNKKASMFADATIARAGASQFDDSQCVVATDRSSVLLHLISFHAYRSLWDAEKTSHQLGIGLASAFIGCSRRRDVPEPLRRVADLVLRIPRIDERLFVE
ncbi:MAG: hypothetical protein WBM46_03020, partial [Polyangiales bacterium]